MMTPQDIREKQFERAVLNGYASTSVDEFMEEIAVEYAALCKEISTQRKKMKILVDEIEKYRASDGAMRMALLQAQKTCDELTAAAQKTAQSTLEAAQNEANALIAKATADSESILASAQRQYDEIVGSIAAAADQEEARLAEAKRSSAQFIENMCKLCTRQLQYFEAFASIVPSVTVEDADASDSVKIPEEPAEKAAITETPAPVTEEAESIEDPEAEVKSTEEPEPEAEAESIEEPEPETEAESAEEPESAIDAVTPTESSEVDLPEEEDSLANFMSTFLSVKEEEPSEVDDATKQFNFDDLNGLNFGR